MSNLELHILSYFITECSPWTVAHELSLACEYYVDEHKKDNPGSDAPSLTAAKEAFEFAAGYMHVDHFAPAPDPVPSHNVISDLKEIIELFDPKPFDYHAYLRSPEWKAKRDAQCEAAGWRCQVCNSAKQLNCHHRTYDRISNEIPDDLFVLCADCHQIFHDNGKLVRPPVQAEAEIPQAF